jgi:putative tryptophan/tyrosine transport system substrate-binding protein
MLDLTRRQFIRLLGGVAAWPLAARAQQDRTRLVGLLMGIESGPDARSRVAAFRRALRETGWIEGKNVLDRRDLGRG